MSEPVLAIVGPTASGKSTLALAVARALPGVELVSVDSMQVYRGMDIGTGKPSSAERDEVPHHGLDLADPDETVTVVRYRSAYEAARREIGNRGNHAVMVGGTGLYLRAVIDGLEPPGQWPAIKARLDADPDLAGLYACLRALDPVAAARMEPGNRRRITRALEVCLGSQRAFSSFGPGLDSYPPSPVVQLGLRVSRPVLAARIARRVEAMVSAGWLDEARALRVRSGGLSATASQALGYAELFGHLDGGSSLDAAIERIVARTRRFASRQERWFRRDPRITWIDVDDPLDALPLALSIASGALRACV